MNKIIRTSKYDLSILFLKDLIAAHDRHTELYIYADQCADTYHNRPSHADSSRFSEICAYSCSETQTDRQNNMKM